MMTVLSHKLTALLYTETKADFLEACKLVSQINDDSVYAKISQEFPLLTRYDGNGNYIGQVSNEDGWNA